MVRVRSSWGRASTMSSHSRKSVQPSLRALEMAYLVRVRVRARARVRVRVRVSRWCTLR